jgi:DNA-binding GntR family transcriptional regulator
MRRVGSRPVDATVWLRANRESGRPSRRAILDWTLVQLYELLFAGEYATGEVLSEVEVSTRLQVSRTPVRLAFQQLTSDGLLINSEETGKTRVAAFGVDDIQELYEIRGVLEGLAHREAAGRISEEGMAELDELLQQMLAGGETGEMELAADIRFHEVICQAAGRHRLVTILRRMWLQTFALVRQLDLGHIYPDRAEIVRVHDDHAAILTALRKGDAAASEQAVIEHLRRAQHSLLRAVATSQQTPLA